MSKFDTAWLNAETGEVHLPRGRLVWPALLVAKINRKFPDKPARFNSVVLIPKAANFAAVGVEIARAAEEKHGKDWKKKIKKDKYPLTKTADNASLAEYAAEFPYMMNAAANLDFKPFIFGPDAKEFRGNESEIYSGRWAIIAGNAWGYDTGSNGVGWNLNRVQLLENDEPIAGGRSATSSGFDAFTGNVGGTSFDVGNGAGAEFGAPGRKPTTTDEAMDDDIPF